MGILEVISAVPTAATVRRSSSDRDVDVGRSLVDELSVDSGTN